MLKFMGAGGCGGDVRSGERPARTGFLGRGIPLCRQAFDLCESCTAGTECVRTQSLAQRTGQELGLGDRWEMTADGVLCPGGQIVLPLRERAGRLREWHRLPCKNCNRGRCRRRLIDGQRTARRGSCRPYGSSDEVIVPVAQYNVSVARSKSRSKAGSPPGRVLLHATTFSPIHATSHPTSASGRSLG